MEFNFSSKETCLKDERTSRITVSYLVMSGLEH